ncbi:hypothetical protein GUITHDRAFT_122289 [Guillardia theta CCMP2712]|uniref:Amine oxidase domain-containing protein n=1 Tax=Guillardia theta (strain CCMP2712) TaxID=905079 RepID=L1I6N7_GUITC|nr:hypothetical protein GUITHDRAFT_122289 [Guillardia theta CCMP2712]EKX31530.1 hypothetical protein GUITHDRAFT_122289 [Guillardia theta CCMP2712]|eukprot:XP_005818510.1 hypothetical protein GUITHDRAFT_122289 [Guillardia theta CCMP2712]
MCFSSSIAHLVSGVRTKDGGLLEADVVVANADLPYVYQNLLPDKKMGEKFSHLKYTSSAIMFYWGMDKQFTELSVHNMFLAKNFRSSFDDIFKRFTLPEEPSFYIHVPSRIDPTAAPPNQDTFMVLVPCGHIEEAKDQQWDELIARARAAVLRKLKEEVKLESIEEHIKFEEIISPAIWKDKFNLAKGSCFGLSHTFTQLGYLRPQNQHDTLRNLFFTGCST